MDLLFLIFSHVAVIVVVVIAAWILSRLHGNGKKRVGAYIISMTLGRRIVSAFCYDLAFGA